jgi:hypothetical protein
MQRPVVRIGDVGMVVAQAQAVLAIQVDGDFGGETQDAVEKFQADNELPVDGVIGPDTWAVMEEDFGLPPYPPPLPDELPPDAVSSIIDVVSYSGLLDYSWEDRGAAPSAYLNGMAVAYAVAFVRWVSGDPIFRAAARADTGDDAIDALSWYASNFEAMGLSNNRDGIDTLRHLYVLMIGLGMRESSGKYCEGRDMSASNVSAETCEAGLFQMSWNASNCSTDMRVLFDQYTLAYENGYDGYSKIFSQDVECSADDWECYGGGDGAAYQEMAKALPIFAVETAAVALRRLRQHWGPINRKEAELRMEAEEMLIAVQEVMTGV